MFRPSVPFLLIASVLSVAACSAGAQNTAPVASDPVSPASSDTAAAAEQPAWAAAQDWLEHVDDGAWEAAWGATTPGLRDTVAQEQWREQRIPSRAALGSARARRLVQTIARDSLRRAPDAGPFVLLRYHSTFGPELYVETVLVEDTGDAWQVAGYEVGPVTGHPDRGGTGN